MTVNRSESSKPIAKSQNRPRMIRQVEATAPFSLQPITRTRYGYPQSTNRNILPVPAADRSEVDITEQIETGSPATSSVTPPPVVTSSSNNPNTESSASSLARCSWPRSPAADLRAAGPRVSPATLVRFLGKLDSLGLLAARRHDDAASAHKQQRGLYIRFRLFDPDQLLGWLDRVFGWALTKTFIISSFFLMLRCGFLECSSRIDEFINILVLPVSRVRDSGDCRDNADDNRSCTNLPTGWPASTLAGMCARWASC